jgi:PD-(D/E)XK nuclease superfamily protein
LVFFELPLEHLHGLGGREGEVEQKDQRIGKYEDGSEQVIGALIEVHRALGPLKAIERLLPLHAAQLLTYMKLSAVSAGLLVNFNVTSLRQGLRRLSLPGKGQGVREREI